MFKNLSFQFEYIVFFKESTMSAPATIIHIGTRVEIIGKDLKGTVAYIGGTDLHEGILLFFLGISTLFKFPPNKNACITLQLIYLINRQMVWDQSR